jgi:hypothetical protein
MATIFRSKALQNTYTQIGIFGMQNVASGNPDPEGVNLRMCIWLCNFMCAIFRSNSK